MWTGHLPPDPHHLITAHHCLQFSGLNRSQTDLPKACLTISHLHTNTGCSLLPATRGWKSMLWPSMATHNLVHTTCSLDITSCSREAVWVHALPHQDHIEAHGWCCLSPEATLPCLDGGHRLKEHLMAWMTFTIPIHLRVPLVRLECKFHGGMEVRRIKNYFSPLPILIIWYFFLHIFL